MVGSNFESFFANTIQKSTKNIPFLHLIDWKPVDWKPITENLRAELHALLIENYDNNIGAKV